MEGWLADSLILTKTLIGKPELPTGEELLRDLIYRTGQVCSYSVNIRPSLYPPVRQVRNRFLVVHLTLHNHANELQEAEYTISICATTWVWISLLSLLRSSSLHLYYSTVETSSQLTTGLTYSLELLCKTWKGEIGSRMAGKWKEQVPDPGYFRLVSIIQPSIRRLNDPSCFRIRFGPTSLFSTSMPNFQPSAQISILYWTRLRISNASWHIHAKLDTT